MSLEVELLLRVELLGASGHNLTVARDNISLVEVIDVVSQRGLVQLGQLRVELKSKVLETRVFDVIELDQVRCKLGNSGSDLVERIVRKRGTKLLREGSQDHPVFSAETGRRLSSAGLLRSTVSVDIKCLFLKVGSSRNDEISIVSALITSVTLINNEGILRNLLVSEVVSTKKVDNLGLLATQVGSGDNTEIESTDSAGFVVQNVDAVPLLLLVNDIGGFTKLVNVVQDSSTISTLQSGSTDKDHWKLGLL